MNPRAFELNLLFAVAGVAILYGARGWQTWRALLRELGLAYILGLAAIGVSATLALELGIGLSRATVLVLWLIVMSAGAAAGLVRRSPWPRTYGGSFGQPTTLGSWIGAVLAAIVVVLLGSLYAAFRHAPLTAYDAWNIWVPKAKTIYFFGGLDDRLWHALPHPSYPLFVPALDAMAFRFAHSTDPSVLAQQYGFLLIGLVAALASLLAPLTRRGLLWLFLALVLVIPELSHRWFQLLADWTLDVFFAVSALMLLRWLRTRERWLLYVLPLTIAATLVTKREGQVLVLCLLLGAGAATAREWRSIWPRGLALFVGAYVVSQLPWRVWWTSRGLPSDLTEGGIAHPGSVSRLLSSIHIVGQLVFSYQLWLLAVPLGLIAVIAAVAVRRELRPAGALYLVTAASSFAAFVWAIWATPTIPLSAADRAYDPVPREAASLALLSVAFAPVFVSAVLDGIRFPVFELAPVAAARHSWRRVPEALTAARPRTVLTTLVVAQWALVLGFASQVRHAKWIFYQGGDQLWFYTSGWLLAHGHFAQPGVGYLWPTVLAPIAFVLGPNLLQAFPAVIVIQFVFLLPIALLALYGIARRIGGRLFGYWAAVVWLAVPLIGIWYTEPGYHQRFTEVLLPQGFGLTGTADFATMVAILVAAYFCARAICDAARSPGMALAAGVAAGAAIALKPSSALFLVGPALAFAVVRWSRGAAAYAIGLVPSVVALAFVKWRGFGYLPLLHSATGVRTAAAPALMPFGSLTLPSSWSWHVFVTQLDQLREHFWSARLVEWLVIAGAIALFIRSRRLGALVVGWFGAIVIIKTGSGRGDLEGGSLLRLLMPAYPAFVILLASLPFLIPGLSRRLRSDETAGQRALYSRQTTIALIAAVLLTAVVPVAAYAVAHPLTGNPLRAANLQAPPIPVGQNLGVAARTTTDGVSLTWTAQHPTGGPVFYHVFRRDPKAELANCSATGGAARCQLALTDLGTTRSASFVDRTAGKQRFVYYVGVAANWLNDPAYGDVYELSRGASPGP